MLRTTYTGQWKILDPRELRVLFTEGSEYLDPMPSRREVWRALFHAERARALPSEDGSEFRPYFEVYTAVASCLKRLADLTGQGDKDVEKTLDSAAYALYYPDLDKMGGESPGLYGALREWRKSIAQHLR
jgi:hypothetical protein